MTEPPFRKPAPAPLTPWAFVFGFLAFAAFALTSRYPGYVHHDTAEIAMWSTLGWPAGLPKHPPFLPWLFRAYSYLVALNWVSLSVLTAANIALGAWAVWRIALIALDVPRAAVAAVLYLLAPAGTWFALKLNHNAILVSLWPLTILAFLKCLDAKTARTSALTGLAFGALAAAGMLAKYYTGVLLASCVIAALASPDRRRFFASPGGYIAVLVFAALMTPHALWVLRDGGGGTLGYALHETERETRLLGHFLTVTPIYLAPPLLGFLALRRWMGAAVLECRRTRELAILAVMPFALTAVLIAAFKLRGATMWTLPDFSVVPVLLSGLLAVPLDAQLAAIKRMAGALLATVALLGPVVLMAAFASGEANTVEPRAEVAVVAGHIFERAAGRAPAIVAGDPQSATSAFLALASHPHVFSNFDPASAPWVTPEALDRDGLLIICRPATGCDGEAESVKLGRASFSCPVTAQRRLMGLVGRPMSAIVTVVAPKGPKFGVQSELDRCRVSAP